METPTQSHMREAPIMSKVRWIEPDVDAETIAVAVGEADGEVRTLGVIPNGRPRCGGW